MVGKFIVFEGCDGSGLSTHSKLFADYLKSKDIDVLLTKESTNNSIGTMIKETFLKEKQKIDPTALQLLFCADRAQHLAEEIEPALTSGKTVVCDRYILSTLAFGSLSCDLNLLKQVNSQFRNPDLTFIIDVPPEVSMQRIKASRTGIELYEKLETLKKVRENYKSLKDYFPNTFIVDNNRPLEQVAEEIKKIADRL